MSKSFPSSTDARAVASTSEVACAASVPEVEETEEVPETFDIPVYESRTGKKKKTLRRGGRRGPTHKIRSQSSVNAVASSSRI